jgi:hypothetical protein
MFLVERSNFAGRRFLEGALRRDALPGRSPHVSNVEIFRTVVIEVEPGDAHTRPYVLCGCLSCNIGKCTVAAIPVEIFAAEIIDYIEIGPPIAVVVIPSAAKAVARVVLVQS